MSFSCLVDELETPGRVAATSQLNFHIALSSHFYLESSVFFPYDYIYVLIQNNDLQM